ncbi:MAG: hypothetical protein ACPL7D_00830 [Candidatus Sumerlaeaceae bacterium]
MDRQIEKQSAKGEVVQRGCILVATLFAFATSFYAWRYSPHVEGLRRVYPTWYYGDFVIFDGYGPYSQWLAAAIVRRPGAIAHLVEFLRFDPHAHTPLYPFLCALVILGVGNVVVAHVSVTVAASLVALWLFTVLLRTQWPTSPPRVRQLAYLGFLLHPGVASGLARPMPDSLALALVLGFFLALLRFHDTGRLRWLTSAAVLAVCAILTKTVMVLLVLTAVFWWILDFRSAHRATTRRRLVRIGAPLLAGIVVGVVFFWWLLRETEAMNVLATAACSAWYTVTTPSLLFGHVPAFALFLVIAFGLYPLVWRNVCFRREELPGVRLLVLWGGIYLIQRIVFVGFNLAYGRARYTMPLAPAVVLLSVPGLERLWQRGGWHRWLASAPWFFHLAIWCTYLLSLKGSVSR